MRFKITLDRPKSAEKPVSLHPLAFKDALASLLLVKPPVQSKRRRRRGSERPEPRP